MKSLKEPPMASDKPKKSETGLVFSIQHFCLHDGPGIRSLVFFKGCPLRCVWCQNPESWTPNPELGFKAHLCTDCRTCVAACPEEAMQHPGQIRAANCKSCFACVDACPSGALIRFGTVLSTQEVMEELRPEYPFYQSSGGVTFSGGEPTLYPEFTAELARCLKQDGIHVAIETCGLFGNHGNDRSESGENAVGQSKSKAVDDLLHLIDLVLFDIKLFHPEAHRQFCGTPNRMIKENLTMLADRFHQKGKLLLWPRMPIIPGITDTVENLKGWGNLLAERKLNKLTLVPFHNLGDSKREWLQLKPAPRIETRTGESLNKARRILAEIGISCYEPGEEDWPQPSPS